VQNFFHLPQFRDFRSPSPPMEANRFSLAQDAVTTMKTWQHFVTKSLIVAFFLLLTLCALYTRDFTSGLMPHPRQISTPDDLSYRDNFLRDWFFTVPDACRPPYGAFRHAPSMRIGNALAFARPVAERYCEHFVDVALTCKILRHRVTTFQSTFTMRKAVSAEMPRDELPSEHVLRTCGLLGLDILTRLRLLSSNLTRRGFSNVSAENPEAPHFAECLFPSSALIRGFVSGRGRLLLPFS